MKHKGALILVLTLFSVTGLRAASFDCTKARSKVEKAICSDPELSKLDEQLAIAYKNALATHPLPSYVRVRQRDWLSSLPDADTQRLKEEYRSRIVHLNASEVMVYSDASKTFTKDDGLTAAELWNADGKWHLSVWGEGQINLDHGWECIFDGDITEPFRPNGKDLAVNKDDGKVAFALTGSTFRFVGAPDICVGMGSIPADLELKRFLKR